MSFRSILFLIAISVCIFSCQSNSNEVEQRNSLGEKEVNQTIVDLRGQEAELKQASDEVRIIDTLISDSNLIDDSAKSKVVEPVRKKRVLPVIQFDKVEFNFDTIDDGEVVEHHFSFTNTGNMDLIINGTEVTCGCTVPSYPFLAIKPGEKGEIGVRYNSVGKRGHQRAKVTVKTNAIPQNYKIYMAGFVRPKNK